MTHIIEDIIIYSLIYSLAVMGLSLVVGYSRVFVMSQAAIFGIGGFTFAILSSRNITSDLLLIVPLALVIGGVLALVTGLPLFRISGDYYIVASLAFQIVIMQGLVNWSSLSGGPPGLYELNTPTVAGLQISSSTDMIWVLLPAIAIAMGVLAWVVRMPYGKALIGMSDDEAALEAGGIRTSSMKISVFVLAGMLAGGAGVLYVAFLGVASPGDFSTTTSIVMIAMVLVGGAGSLIGPFIGAVLLSSLPYWLNLLGQSGYIAGAVTGGVLLVVAFVSPDGITALVGRRRGRSGHRRPALHGVQLPGEVGFGDLTASPAGLSRSSGDAAGQDVEHVTGSSSTGSR